MLKLSRYANQAASDAHLASKPVQDLIQLFTTGDVLASPPEVHNCPVKHKKTTGSPLSVSSNPIIVLLQSTSSSAEEWRGATEGAKGLNFIAVVEDKETNGVRAEMILDGWTSYEAFESGAGKSVTKAANESVQIRPIAGYLGRKGKSKL